MSISPTCVYGEIDFFETTTPLAFEQLILPLSDEIGTPAYLIGVFDFEASIKELNGQNEPLGEYPLQKSTGSPT